MKQTNKRGRKYIEDSNLFIFLYHLLLNNSYEPIMVVSVKKAIILYILEGYNDTSNDPDLPRELDNIFKELEGVVDTYYNTSED